jgi:hypothetical protein
MVSKGEKEMNTKQVKFRGIGEDSFQGGIMVNDGQSSYVICGCCGGVYEMGDIDEIKTYPSWVDISEEITGGE